MGDRTQKNDASAGPRPSRISGFWATSSASWWPSSCSWCSCEPGASRRPAARVEAPVTVAVTVATAVAPPAPPPARLPAPSRSPSQPAAPVVAALEPLDRAAVARAEEQIDAASRDRARAEARAEDAAKRLAEATAQAALDASKNRKLALRVRDPSAQLASVTARGGFLKAERDRLKAELGNVAQAPRPKAKRLVDKNPVAKPTDGGRVPLRGPPRPGGVHRPRSAHGAGQGRRPAPDPPVREVAGRGLEGRTRRRLLARVRPRACHAQRHRRADRAARPQLRPSRLGDRPRVRGTRRDLRANPPADLGVRPRDQPASARREATITMWVYPDGFALYRKLRDDLHARGFTGRRPPLARRHGDPRQPGRLALGGAVRTGSNSSRCTASASGGSTAL